jgi:hypothetical protein
MAGQLPHTRTQAARGAARGVGSKRTSSSPPRKAHRRQARRNGGPTWAGS